MFSQAITLTGAPPARTRSRSPCAMAGAMTGRMEGPTAVVTRAAPARGPGTPPASPGGGGGGGEGGQEGGADGGGDEVGLSEALRHLFGVAGGVEGGYPVDRDVPLVLVGEDHLVAPLRFEGCHHVVADVDEDDVVARLVQELAYKAAPDVAGPEVDGEHSGLLVEDRQQLFLGLGVDDPLDVLLLGDDYRDAGEDVQVVVALAGDPDDELRHLAVPVLHPVGHGDDGEP